MTDHATDNAENRETWAQHKQRGDELAAEAEARGDVLVRLGDTESPCEARGADDARQAVQFATIPQSAQQFFQNFQLIAAMIGANGGIDDYDALNEVMRAGSRSV